MALSGTTREQIREYLLKQMTRYVRESLSNAGEKPFHERLMPPLSAVPFSERSFSTRLGGWFQNIARMVALQYNQEAATNHLVEGRIRPAASAHIEAILAEMDHGHPRRPPNRATDIAEVLTVQSPGGSAAQVRSDLFMRTRAGRELYFEIKTPGPNKGQCVQMKRDILTIMALRQGNDAQAYAACGYNPFGDGAPYTANFVAQFLEVGEDILVGRSFWRTVGEDSTYDELLDVASEVGRGVQSLLFPR